MVLWTTTILNILNICTLTWPRTHIMPGIIRMNIPMWLEYWEKLWHHTSHIQWRLHSELNILQQSEEERPPCLYLAKHPSCKGVHLSQLIQDYRVTNFSNASAQYWVNSAQSELLIWEVVNAMRYYYLPFQKVSVFHNVKFHNILLTNYPGSLDFQDHIHVQLSCKDKWGCEIPGRFDTALEASNLITKYGDIQGEILSWNLFEVYVSP